MPVLIAGLNLPPTPPPQPPPVDIGLTDLPKCGGAMAQARPVNERYEYKMANCSKLILLRKSEISRNVLQT